MNVRLFQQMAYQMRDVMNRDLGIITDSGFVVSSNDACISNNDLDCVLSFTADNTDTFTYNGFTYKPIVSMGKVDYIIFVKGDDTLARNYADILQNDNDIQEIRCNVLLDGLSEGAYTSDFVCVKANGDLMVRECVFRKFLTKPMTVKLLDASRDYWLNHGVSDWGMVIDEE